MKIKKTAAFLLCLLMLCALTACWDQAPENSIDSHVLAAWEGDYSKENRAEAIKEYDKRYIPVYSVNLEGDTVSFQVDFEAKSCGSVLLAPVDDSTKNGELNTIVDFVTDATVEGSTVTVDIGWWWTAEGAAKNYSQWSYLFCVKDAEGVNHYYYFRVDYST